LHILKINLPLQYINNLKQKEIMKNLNETRMSALRVINNIITLKANVSNGCYSDQAELTIQMLRLEQIKNWAIQNDQLQEIRHYFASKNFGQNNQFAAIEISKYFN
jgi:L-cysteine desulfidase